MNLRKMVAKSIRSHPEDWEEYTKEFKHTRNRYGLKHKSDKCQIYFGYNGLVINGHEFFDWGWRVHRAYDWWGTRDIREFIDEAPDVLLHETDAPDDIFGTLPMPAGSEV